MKAKLYFENFSRPVVEFDASTTEDENRIFEAEIKKQKARLLPTSITHKLVPHVEQERKPIHISKFRVEIEGEVFIPQDDVMVYFYKDKVELLNNLMLEPEEE